MFDGEKDDWMLGFDDGSRLGVTDGGMVG